MDRKQAYAQLVSRGWVEYLVPVIPPDATLAPGSTIRPEDRGKVPGTRLADGTYYGLANWSELRATDRHVAGWQHYGNIGLITRALRAIDIDDDNVERVAALRAVLALRCGLYAWRGRPNSPRGCAVFRAGPDITGKLTLTWEGGRAEVLGLGNQLVAWGTHPSGAEYEWSGLTSPFESPPGDFPLLPEAEIPPLLEAFRAALEGLGVMVAPVRRTTSGVNASGNTLPLGHVERIAADIAQAGRALAAIRNDFDYDGVVRMIACFMGAVGGNRAALDQHLIPWLETWEGGTNDKDWIETKLASFRAGTRAGADQLFRCAREAGWLEVPAGTFERETAVSADVVPIEVAKAKARVRNATSGGLGLPRATLVGNQYTDQQLALAFWDDHGATRLRLHPQGQWLCWDEERRLWEASEAACATMVRTYMGAVVRGLGGESHKDEQLAFRIEAAGMADKVLQILRHQATQREWDANPEHLNTPGALIDLRTGERRDCRPDDYCRARTGCSPVFDHPDVFMQAALGIFDGDMALLQAWIDWMALNLLGKRVVDNALILEGSGRNGKSLLLDVVERMLGNVAASGYAQRVASPDCFDRRRTERSTHSGQLASLDGARAALFSEVDENFQPDEALLKAATAGEIVAARRIYKGDFSFRFSSSITIASNVVVNFTSSPALRGRIQTIHLRQRFPDDRVFYNAVVDDAPRVLGMVINRCTQILRGAETFWAPQSWRDQQPRFAAVRTASEERFDFADPISMVVRALVQRNKRERVPAEHLRDTVRRWLEKVADKSEVEAFTVAAASSDQRLSREIGRVMKVEYGAASRVIHGVRFYPDTALVANPTLPFID